MKKQTVLVGLLMSLSCAQTEETDPDASQSADMRVATPDTGSNDVARGVDDSTPPNMDAGSDSGGAADMPTDLTSTQIMESEPNDGTTVDEVNELLVGQSISGAVELDGQDIFAVPTTAGTVYEVTITASGPLAPHITVIDDGRGTDPAGGDYVKITRDDRLQFLAMGAGGHLVVVRDSRNVDGGSVGGDDFTYVVEVRALDLMDVTQGAVTFPGTLGGSLAYASDVHLWTFDGAAGMDVIMDMSMPGGDGRLYIFSAQTGSWIARHDNRAMGDPDPLIDAPLTASGAMYVVVEDISEVGRARNYSVATSTP